MKNLEQLTKEFLENFNLDKLGAIPTNSYEGYLDFFKSLEAKQGEIKAVFDEMQINDDFSGMSEMGVVPLIFEWLDTLLERYRKEVIETKDNGVIRDGYGDYVGEVIKSLNIVRDTVINNSRDYDANAFANARTLSEMYDNLENIKRYSDTHSVPFDIKMGKPLKNVYGGVDFYNKYHDYMFHTKQLNKLLTTEIINDLQKSKSEEDLKKVEDRFQFLLDNLDGYKAYIAYQFVTGRQMRKERDENRNIGNDCFLVNTLDLTKSFGVKDYLFILNGLEKSNQREAAKLKEGGKVFVYHLMTNKNVPLYERRLKTRGLETIEVNLQEGESWDDAFAKLLNSCDQETVLRLLASKPAGEYDYKNKKIITSPCFALAGGANFVVSNVYERDTQNGMLIFEKTFDDPSSSLGGFLPLGGLSSEKSVFEQVTPSMLRLLVMEFFPDLNGEKSRNVEQKDIHKLLSKYAQCKVVGESLAKLKDAGVNIDIFKSYNDGYSDKINRGGLIVQEWNEIELPQIYDTEELTRSFVKNGLAKSVTDTMNRFFDERWLGKEWAFWRDYSSGSVKKQLNSTIAEVMASKPKGTEDFLSVITKFCLNVEENREWINGSRSVKNKSGLSNFVEFTGNVYEALKVVDANSLLDNNGTSPLIRIFNDLNKFKSASLYHAPLFRKNDNNADTGYGIVDYAFRKQQWHIDRKYNHASIKRLDLIKNMNNELSVMFNLILPKEFFKGENVKALISGKDEKGNNILHHLLQNPKLFASRKELIDEMIPEKEVKETPTGRFMDDYSKPNLFRIVDVDFGAHQRDENLSLFSDFLKEIPPDELKRLALEKNNEGRTPLEELCYFAEFVKERAYCSFAVAQGYVDLITKVIDIDNKDGIEKNYKVLQKDASYFQEEDEINQLSPSQIVTAKDVSLVDVIKYLSTPNVHTSYKPFAEVVKNSEIDHKFDFLTRKNSGAIKNAMSKLPM